MNDNALSKNDILIRFSEERWRHILSEHPELALYPSEVLTAVSEPEAILDGQNGALLAVRLVEAGKWLVVVYRELADDGFVVTAFLTRRQAYLNKRRKLWP